MKSKKLLPPQELLLKVFSYSEETGVLLWKINPSRSVMVEMRAGEGRKYRRGTVMLCGHNYMTACIIWKMVHNEEPETVDHRDRGWSNDRLNNLRPATQQQNSCNRRVAVTSRSGVTGVMPRGKKFVAYIRHHGKLLSLGTHETLDSAISARRQAEMMYQGSFGAASSAAEG